MAETERARRLLHRVTAGIRENPVTHVADLPAREARHTDWPSWADPRVVDALRSGGVERPWAHQTEAASLAFAGRHVVVSTGTASGKSLCYQLPVLSTLAADDKACALYLSPTKALGADQLRSVSALDIPGVRAASYDGDTPMAERDWVRAHARWVFTNPDMLHRGILAAHSRWARLFRKLSYVVIDECHSYRGVFGSHVALLLRRLQRVARHYGSSPVFILASATTAEPGEFACRLVGADCVPVVEDASPRGARTVALWEPPLMEDHRGENGAPVRRSAGAEASRILAELVIEGARTLAFVRSRRGAELTALGARRLLSEVDGELPRQVAAYRAGFLPEERRALERALLSGELKGVATTNALELGVDIAGLDAVVLAGYPGTLASFWQQAGRAGRSGDDALVVFVARDDPLDTYLVHHPEAVLERPVETAVLDPSNPYVLAPQLACAAAELPLTTGELETFGGAAAREVLDRLVADRLLRRRPSGWYWTSRDRPHYEVDIRGSGGEQIAVVEADTSRLLGTVDPGSACTTVHPGAVYLHQGSSYVVDELDLEAGIALVHAEDPEWTTSAREVADIAVLNTQERLDYGGVTVCLGEVAVTSQVVGYLRRRPSGEVLDQVALDLPAQTLETRAVWYTISPELLEASRPAEPSGAPKTGGAGEAASTREANGTREGTNSQEAASEIAEAREVTSASAAREVSDARALAEAREVAVPPMAPGAKEVANPRAVAGARQAAVPPEAAGAREVASARAVTGVQEITASSGVGGPPEAAGAPEATGAREVGGAPGGAGLDPARIPGALHAAEHAAIGLLPLFATCDRWDIGGVSTALHADTGEATVFVHDGHPGGAGFADRGFAAVVPWLAATREAIISCECPAGCPSCVQSPKCGNGNDPLDKAGAVAVLETVLGAVSRHSARHDHGVAQAAAN
ncbi:MULTISPECIES: DEAD/DEAH box helicase [Amycolatopsis]|uniref:DEAD/DEAH box helicase n=1 Tax=Amycolatopsis TaxID=1813 RepID=UPI000B8AB537|nr:MULTISPECIES: DEAD/DEAH box helicase [Amycolatopsis]OXM72156.1 DEAD/DEAH box helicase [Amycolatopsis sp. KNN50.9b]